MVRATTAFVDLDSLAQVVVGAAYEVSNILGAGFLEKLYERALTAELTARGIPVQTQVGFPVQYKGTLVGEFIPDLVVNGQLIVELKCVDEIGPIHLAQCLSYLHASRLTLALLINFQHPKVMWRRVVLGHKN